MTDIPLRLFLEEARETRRHCIPYFTYVKSSYPPSSPLTRGVGPATASRRPATPREEDGKEDPFLMHLLSGETRLPDHPLVRGALADPTEYETYVGEDDWKGGAAPHAEKNGDHAGFNACSGTTVSRGGEGSTESNGEPNVKEDCTPLDEPSLSPVPSFEETLIWITNALEYLSSVEADEGYRALEHGPLSTPPTSEVLEEHLSGKRTRLPSSATRALNKSSAFERPKRRGVGAYGVVLAGKFAIADDCPWAVCSRTSALQSTREVVVVMQSSRKFALDLARQREEVCRGAATTLEFSLVRVVGKGGADEWRVFIPYQLVWKAQKRETNVKGSLLLTQQHDQTTAEGTTHRNFEQITPTQQKTGAEPADSTGGRETTQTLPEHHRPETNHNADGNTRMKCRRSGPGDHDRVWEAGVLALQPLLSYTAVSQRFTDVCYPALATWDETTHDQHHQLLVQRVLKAKVLNRLRGYYTDDDKGRTASLTPQLSKSSTVKTPTEGYEKLFPASCSPAETRHSEYISVSLPVPSSTSYSTSECTPTLDGTTTTKASLTTRLPSTDLMLKSKEEAVREELQVKDGLLTHHLKPLLESLGQSSSSDSHSGENPLRDEVSEWNAASEESPSGPCRLPYILLLGVDVIWNSDSLPIYLLSGKMHLFARAEEENDKRNRTTRDEQDEFFTAPPWLGTMQMLSNARPAPQSSSELKEDNSSAATVSSSPPCAPAAPRPLALSPFALPSPLRISGGRGTWRRTSTLRWTPPHVAIPSESSKRKENTDKREDEGDDDSEASGFFRLLRSPHLWNEYLHHVVQGREQSSALLAPQKRYCVVATDAEDLITSEERQKGNAAGLPLELLHPELLVENEEMKQFFEMWKHQLEQREREQQEVQSSGMKYP